MTAYIFPGQGSQAKGMGTDLFTKFPELTAEADAILGYSIAKLCIDDPQNQLNLTQFTQPALYVINALTFLDKQQKQHKKIHFFAGHSLGEYNALFAANVFDFETGLKLVKKRGELMSQAANGGMAAVIGLTAEIIKNTLEINKLDQVVIANYNSHQQVVLSGEKNQIKQAETLCQSQGAMMVIPLKVSGAFHSPMMQTAQNEFEAYLNQFQFSQPSTPVISNVLAKPYPEHEIKKYLTQQIANPVRWTETIEYLVAEGIEEFEEVGHGNVLTGLLRRIKAGQ